MQQADFVALVQAAQGDVCVVLKKATKIKFTVLDNNEKLD